MTQLLINHRLKYTWTKFRDFAKKGRQLVLLFFLCFNLIAKSQYKIFVFDTSIVDKNKLHMDNIYLKKKIGDGSYLVYYDSLFKVVLQTGQLFRGNKVGEITSYALNGTKCQIQNYDSNGVKNGSEFVKYFMDSNGFTYTPIQLLNDEDTLVPFITDSIYCNFKPHKNLAFKDFLYSACYFFDGSPYSFLINIANNNYLEREICFYKNSIVKRIWNLYNGEKHGYQVEFYSNGQKKMESCYKNEYAKGTGAENLMKMDCNLCRDSMFVGGVVCVDTIPKEGGILYCNILENSWYENGIKEAVWTKIIKDKIVSYNCKFYYPSGKLSSVENFSFNYKKNGLNIYYNEDGSKKSEKLFVNDVLLKHIKY